MSEVIIRYASDGGNPTLSPEVEARMLSPLECHICAMDQAQLNHAYRGDPPKLYNCFVCGNDVCWHPTIPSCSDACKAEGCANVVCIRCQARHGEQVMVNGYCEDHYGDQ